MVVTPSTMQALGTAAPEFRLPEPASGVERTLSDVRRANGVLVVFLSNHCPFVQLVMPHLAMLGSDLNAMRIGMVGIASNDVEMYPHDGPQFIAEVAKTKLHSFPYVFDSSQETAKAYRAACTPDYFLYDSDLKLVYRGQLDTARPGNGKPVTGATLREAVSKMLNGESISAEAMRPSLGCNIKWRIGNEPSYFNT